VLNRSLRFVSLLAFLLEFGRLEAGDITFPIGVARTDITPGYPIRLTGYAVRKTESEGVEQRLWAKALALGSDQEGPAVLVTVDNCGVSARVIDEVAKRLNQKAGIPRERIAVCSSHTHSGPCVLGFAPNIFAMPIPQDQQAAIARYTGELIDKLEQLTLAALADRKPALLGWTEGKVGFAKNRRTPGGPVDHALPILCATGLDGKVRAVVANYACHCTTLGGEFNKLCGDWAGYAQQAIESELPGAVALIAIGCGADANPAPRGGIDGGLEFAKLHGHELAAEVKRMLEGHLTPVRENLVCRAKRFELPFDTLPTREQWIERAKQEGIVGYHAKRNLERLDRGETLPATLPYFVQTWNFGGQLAMVFLAGEAVVDYSLRLKREFDAERLWVSAYANDVPCYIPSRRILQEGGYEAETSLWYYDRPARLAPAVEELIVGAVHELMPKEFVADPKRAEFPPAKSPDEALAAFQTKAGFTVELAAAEPLVIDPVAIDWDASGRLWVVEMRDYPAGMDGHWKPGGRVKFLEDIDGDGKYDRATVFLDRLPFPTGVTAWNKGVLICAAPDIIYAEDTDGDGKADLVKKLFSGFATENYQARVNSLSLGLDNWFYGANGLIGGTIRGVGSGVGVPPAFATSLPARDTGKMPVPLQEVNISGRDFRFRPDTGEFEPAAGLTQQGRVRDDWGNWFGCDNSTLLWHYPLPDDSVRRNPYFAPPEPRVFVPADSDPNQLFPVSRILERFNDPAAAGRTTSACGLGIYRDVLLGTNFYGNAFICEPVHNLVHRLILNPNGVSFRGYRPRDEQQVEFLATKDNWFRPVQARTGPDGALWIVDMYRFVVEHPRWIPAERLATLDVRAGDDKGRIYRVLAAGKNTRPIRNLSRLATAELASALDTFNGTDRDRVHLELLRRKDKTASGPLIELVKTAGQPAVRLQALCALDGLKAATPELLEDALNDPHPAVRRHAIRLSEQFISGALARPVSTAGGPGPDKGPANPSHLGAALLQLLNDPDDSVRYQLALSLGDWDDPRAGQALGQLVQNHPGDKWLRAAVLSSANRFPAGILRSVLTTPAEAAGRKEVIDQLIATVVGVKNEQALDEMLAVIAPPPGKPIEPWHLAALGGLLDALKRSGRNFDSLLTSSSPHVREAATRIKQVLVETPAMAQSDTLDEATRVSAIALLGRDSIPAAADLDVLVKFLAPDVPSRLQTAALTALGRTGHPQVPELLLTHWANQTPTLRGAILTTLLARDEWVGGLLHAMEQGTIAGSEISPANRQRLLNHKNEGIRKRASALLADNQTTSRVEVLAKYQSVTKLTGDPRLGQAVFATNCAGCHSVNGQGFAVGPDLTAFRGKTPQDFLMAILNPSAAIEPRFINYQIDARDGRSLSGVVKSETATSLTLAQAGGVEETILRSEIAAIKASDLSLMPEGLEQNMTPQDLADLIAYLKRSGPRQFGSASPEQAAQQRAEFIKSGVNGVAKIVSASGQLPYPGWLGPLPMPFCRQTDGRSTLIWETMPVPSEIKPNETQSFRMPAALGYISQPSGKFHLLLNGRTVLEFDVTLNSQTWQSDDGRVRMDYTVMENNEEDSCGILQIQVLGTLLAPGQPARFEVNGSATDSQRWFGVYLLP
jgi:putative membrane-bound dehydrogenase-like protein